MRADAPALRRWLLSLGIVLAAHALLLAALLGWPQRMPAPSLAAPAQALMLKLAPAPVAPPAAPTELAPGPAQRERRAATASAVAPPSPASPAPPQATPEPLQTQAPAPAPAPQDTTQDNGDAEASAPPSIAAPVGASHAAPESVAGAAPQARATWQAQLLGHLQRYKRYPRTAQRRGQEGVVEVGVAVDRRGHAGDIRLIRGSGHDALDAEALATLQRADPLPPPPAQLVGDPVQVVIPVDFFLR